jgi:hypothetical protein
MSTPNKIYRVYCYDAAMNEVTGDLIEAASDDEVIAMVEAKASPSKCEIWHGDRLVAQIVGQRLQA